MHELFEAVEAGEIPGREVTLALGGSGGVPVAVRQQMQIGHPDFLTILTARVEATRLPLHEQEAADRDYEAAVRDMPAWKSLVRSLLPTWKVSETFRRYHALLRCTTAALAAERYRRDHRRWPEKLTELVPDYLPAVPQDPFDGRPLRLKRLPDGLVIYSVGDDRVDNGGVMDPDKPVGPGTDIAVRLWDVAHRAQEPPPAAGASPKGGK
jgi:hypothetical protein